MRKIVYILFAGVLSAMLSSCAYLNSLGTQVPDTIDEMIAQEQYGRALDILSYVKPESADYEKLMRQKKKVLLLADRLEKKTISDARNSVRNNEWYKAQQAYEQALVKLPDSEILKKSQDLFLLKRDQHLRRLELKLDLNRAYWLIANSSVQQAIIRVLSEAEKQYSELKDYQNQKEKTARHLLDFTYEALEKKDYSAAHTMLNLIDGLNVETIDRERLSEAKKHLRKVSSKRRLEQEKKTRKLIAALQSDFSNENLLKARRQLDFIERNKKQYSSSQELYDELGSLYRQGIEQGMKAGRTLYSLGKIDEALQIWIPLQRVDKDNQKLQEHINRANRVLEKLQYLGKSGESILPRDEQK